VPLTIKRLATLGYSHRGNLGVEDREAFDGRPDLARLSDGRKTPGDTKSMICKRAGEESAKRAQDISRCL
jgi:hypothetical protein